ncbi:DNA-directed RNA polymerase sigma-70 factor [Actinomadura sp. NBRC 104412]|uniref:RNA polymerase sigma factor n=1 Tax=Actinomadura sp. NBRC 104412 TaxID=3032203 RepID=UPI0024A567F3|nr:RNA polymerase sigma factor [Actinomadura sp. NBRC 104412]GLZ09342.1 DNA-directed RNA polymerase sigma-70 factor [Actinomadura sp. NBRC 104412]
MVPGERASAGSGIDERLSSALRAARCGDQDAFRRLYRAVQPRLLRYLRVLVGDDAAPVAARTWREVATGLPGFRGDFQRFLGWVSVIGRGRAFDHLGGRSPAEVIDERPGRPRRYDHVDPAGEPPSTDAAIALIASLPRDEAEAVMLRTVMGLDNAQAAMVMGRSAGAVQAVALQGLRHLAGRLDQAAASPETPGAAARRSRHGGR